MLVPLAGVPTAAPVPAPPPPCAGETLYNGICLPAQWPPVTTVQFQASERVGGWPGARPAQVRIDVGRQLFVDPFLIDVERSQNHSTSWHAAQYDADRNPILKAEKPWEVRGGGGGGWASVWHGGVWWEPRERLYKLFYTCGNHECLALSRDGLEWERPVLPASPALPTLAAAGTSNVVLEPTLNADDTAWLDLDEPDDSKRYTIIRSEPGKSGGHYSVWNSADGRQFARTVNTSGPCSDASSAFLNPFRVPRKWVYSIKHDTPQLGRMRDYREGDSLAEAADWNTSRTGPRVQWTGADSDDPKPDCPVVGGPPNQTQLCKRVHFPGFRASLT